MLPGGELLPSILPFRFVPRVEIHSLGWFHYSKVMQSEKNPLCSLMVRRAKRINNPRVTAFDYCVSESGFADPKLAISLRNENELPVKVVLTFP